MEALKIVQVFVESPLICGIHVAQDSQYKDLNSLKGKRVAISWYGSGSHLMAYVNAMKLKWNTASNLEFEVVKNLNGAVESLSNKKNWLLYVGKIYYQTHSRSKNIEDVQNQLLQLNIISKKWTYDQLVYTP